MRLRHICHGRATRGAQLETGGLPDFGSLRPLTNLRAGKADVWDSGRMDSSESVGIVYRVLLSIRAKGITGRFEYGMGLANRRNRPRHGGDGPASSDGLESQVIRWKNREDDADREGMRWIWFPGQNALAVRRSRLLRFEQA